ncbi:unnamed protein product [Lampetra planeri]
METFFDNHHPALKSPILVPGPRCATEDTFSRHFESIMESHRAKGTSYNSLDSEELLTSNTQTVLSVDLPTFTPAIHAPVCQSARQIVQLSFAPLAHDERPSLSDSIFTVTGDSDATRAPSTGRRLVWRQIRSWTMTSVNVWVWAAVRPSPTASHRADVAAAKRLAKRLFNLDGFRKSDVARHLSKK